MGATTHHKSRRLKSETNQQQQNRRRFASAYPLAACVFLLHILSRATIDPPVKFTQ